MKVLLPGPLGTARVLLVVACGVVATLAGCAGSPAATPAAAPRVEVVTSTPTPSPPTVVPTPTQTPEATAPILDRRIPRPFTWPVQGACLPQAESLMPNAPRTYRNGVHEGLDFYPGSSCADVQLGTPVVAMFEGTVVRADLDYRDITAQQVRELAALTAAQGFSDPTTLDVYRGRQVWVDHGAGIVTRYCHLSAIAEGVRVGVTVRAGQRLGGVGESGTPEFITAPGTEMHLHAEVRIGDTFLGAGLAPGVVRGQYEQLFGVR